LAAQNLQVELVSTGLWPQGDARDPLGIWGGRHIVTATGTESMKVRFTPAADRAGAYVYTCYSCTIAGISATSEAANGKCRLLTNWPDIDDDAGVQGFSTLQLLSISGVDAFTAPVDGPFAGQTFVKPSDRFILLFDPRPVAGAFDIVELERDRGVNTRQYAFEAWGYFWDRQVLNTPGGPRHPGAS